MRRLIAAAVLTLSLAGAQSARTVPMPAPVNDAQPGCGANVPAAVHVPAVDPGDAVDLDVYVLLDRGITEEQARAVFQDAQSSYAPMNVTLRPGGFSPVTFQGDQSFELLVQARELFPDMERPDGYDLVVTMTSVDIAIGTQTAVAGQVQCVGGIRFPAFAFMVIELPQIGETDLGFLPVTFYRHLRAEILAHEMGHLLGAQHHYANCVEGVPSELDGPKPEASPCTLMFNLADLTSLNFGALEAAVVRGYAEEFARP